MSRIQNTIRIRLVIRKKILATRASLCFKEHQYFLDHTDYDATASSTLAAQGKHNYDVVNIKDDPTREVQSPWVEGVEGDGIGESITLNVKRPLPLYGILIQPGYYDYGDKEPWLKNNRVAALEITLNDEQRLRRAFPMSDSNVHTSSACGTTQSRLTKSKWSSKVCIAARSFATRAFRSLNCALRLAKKPEVHGAR